MTSFAISGLRKRRSRWGKELRGDGQKSRTRFRVMERFSDGKTLLQAFPETGRTNQIRIHLWGLGLPVLGDPTYREGGQRVSNQTLDLSDPPMCLMPSVFPSSIQRRERTFNSMQMILPGWHNGRICRRLIGINLGQD